MRYAAVFLMLALCAGAVSAQERGNQGYSRESGNQGYATPNSSPISPYSGTLVLFDPKDSQAAPYLEASVLMNVKPDAFITVFAVAEEGPTPAESNKKVDAKVASLAAALGGLGIGRDAMFVDFIAQIPVYDYSVSGRTARETQTGFQTKKTVAVRYKDRALFEQIVRAAAGLGIYDLVKVDYVIADLGPVRTRLFEEASRIVARKRAAYEKLLGVTIRPNAVSEERYSTFTPDMLYRTYTAYESGDASTSRVVDKRKTSTSYYDPLTSSNFDMVIDPADVEPSVQVVLNLRVRCEWVKP